MLIQSSRFCRDRRTLACCLAVVLACAPGCWYSSPLRFGEEARTGGRTALSHWEYLEALSQLYQAQVFLNLIRIIEYGEAPLHLEFKGFSTTVEDTGSASLTLEFLDSPAGITVIAGIARNTHDNPITFTPKAELKRSVKIVADAEPVTNQNWRFYWYYGIAFQQMRKPEFKWYHDSADTPRQCTDQTHNGRRDSASVYQLWYRNRLYRLERCFGDDERIALRGAAFPDPVSPRDELGNLTTILSFLSKSTPYGPTSLLSIPLQDVKPMRTPYSATFKLDDEIENSLSKVKDCYDANNKKLPQELTEKELRECQIDESALESVQQFLKRRAKLIPDETGFDINVPAGVGARAVTFSVTIEDATDDPRTLRFTVDTADSDALRQALAHRSQVDMESPVTLVVTPSLSMPLQNVESEGGDITLVPYSATFELPEEIVNSLSKVNDCADKNETLPQELTEDELRKCKIDDSTLEYAERFLELAAELILNDTRFVISVPAGVGAPAVRFSATIEDSTDDLRTFLFAVDATDSGPLKKALDRREKVDEDSPVTLVVTRKPATLDIISPTKRILEIASTEDKPPEKSDVDVLRDILTELRRQSER